MGLRLKIGKDNMPVAGDSLYVFYANTSIKMVGIRDMDTGVTLSNPFTVPSGSDWYGFEPVSSDRVDVWWEEQEDYLIRDVNVSNPYSLTNPFPQYVLQDQETDTKFLAWDKCSGIEITLSQVLDWNNYQEELVSGTNIKTINGQSVLGEGDMIIYGDPLSETDPIFSAWDKSTDISIYEYQISDLGDYQERLVSGTNIKTVNDKDLLGYGNVTITAEEIDPIFTAWDKSTGIAIYESQVVDLYPNTNIDLMVEDGSEDLSVESGTEDLMLSVNYQELLVNEVNIKSINGYSVLGSGNLNEEELIEETDPIFSAWDKSTGIAIYTDQISDLGDYQEQLVSGTDIKTINGQSVLGSGDLVVEFDSFEETDPIFSAWDKSTGITIYSNQISDLGNYEEQLVSGTDIKTINGQSVLGSGNLNIEITLTETDPIFTAWDKSTGITIYSNQISDLGNYEEQLVSGTDIKTINGQSVLGGGDLEVYSEELTGSEIVTLINDELGNTTWQTGSVVDNAPIGDIAATHRGVDSNWLLCDGSGVLKDDYPDLVSLLPTMQPEGTGTHMLTWGTDYYGQLGTEESGTTSIPTVVKGHDDWEKIANGSDTSFGIKVDGTLWAWGRSNYYSALGLETTTNVTVPTQVGNLSDWDNISSYMHTLAIKTDGTLWSWGYNYYGALGLGDTTNRNSPVQVGSLTDWSNISCGGNYSLAIKTDGSLWAWGYNNNGQLGLGNTTRYSSPVQVGSLTGWNSISCGYHHSLAIKTDGTLWAWGENTYGQLGLGNTTRYSSPVQVGSLTDWSNINCGSYHSLAIKTDGTLWAWGNNGNGRLGLGNTTRYSSPVQVGSLNDWNKVSCGDDYSLAIKIDGTLWSWGDNGSGQLGLGDTTFRSSPVQVGTYSNWMSVDCGKAHVTSITEGVSIRVKLPNIPSFDNEKWYIKVSQ